MQNNIKISIIMPVYNVSEYLEKAITSVLEQSFVDFELIIVNDGSTDSSKEICEKFAKIDDRIILINQENMGAHTARNNGIEIAKGEYICFFDSDDYIDKNMLKDFYELTKVYDCNLIISGFFIEIYYNDNEFINVNYIPTTTNNNIYEFFATSNEFRKNSYLNFDKNMFYSPWNKLYKTSIIKTLNLKFKNVYRDDFPFVVDYIKNIDKVLYTKKQYYHFVKKRVESETQKYVAKLYEKREEEHQMMLDLFKYWNLNEDEKSMEMISRRYIDRVIECMVNMFNDNAKLNKYEIKNEIKNILLNKNIDININLSKPKTIYLKIMYIPIKLKNVSLCFIMSKFINFVKYKNIKLFSKLKFRR